MIPTVPTPDPPRTRSFDLVSGLCGADGGGVHDGEGDPPDGSFYRLRVLSPTTKTLSLA